MNVLLHEVSRLFENTKKRTSRDSICMGCSGGVGKGNPDPEPARIGHDSWSIDSNLKNRDDTKYYTVLEVLTVLDQS